MTINVGDGFRLLGKNEFIEQGDEYFSSQDNAWIVTGLEGSRVCGMYRRKCSGVDESIIRIRDAMAQSPEWAAALFGELPEQLRNDLRDALTHFLGDRP